jgi:methylmalonyl-CoA/ethylmalonyl-CoA epimerase
MSQEKVIGKLSHIVLAVKDLDKAKGFFSKLFQVEFTDVGEVPGVGFKSIVCENKLEIISPTRPDSDVAKYIEKKGEGVYAVAFKAPDAGKARAQAESMGIRIVGDINQDDFAGVAHGEVREIWLHPKDTFGMYLMFSQYDD